MGLRFGTSTLRGSSGRRKVDLNRIIQDLKAERDVLAAAIECLERLAARRGKTRGRPPAWIRPTSDPNQTVASGRIGKDLSEGNGTIYKRNVVTRRVMGFFSRPIRPGKRPALNLAERTIDLTISPCCECTR